MNVSGIGRGVVLSLVVAALALEGSILTARAGDWPQWRGPRRDGVSTETNLLTSWPPGGPSLAWTGKGLGAGFSSVAVSGGRIYTMGDQRDGQFVIALDEATGRQLWTMRVGNRHEDGYGGPRATPSIDGDRLYTITTDGDVVCLETAAGRLVWRRSMTREFGGRMMSMWMYAESPLVDGEHVIVTPGAPKAALVALNKMTGVDVWRAAVPNIGSRGGDGAGYSSIVISNGGGVKQYIQLMGRGLVSIRASDGWFMWGYNRVANDIANISTPIVSGNLVFASTGYETGAALLELLPDKDGRVTFKERYFHDSRTLQNHHGGFVLLNGVLYGGHGHNNGFPFAMDLATGRLLWERVRGAGTGSAAVTAADGHLYFRYQNGTMALIAANPTEYQLQSTFEIPHANLSWSHPVIADGRLYLREQDALYAYAIKR
jgi:outer membrane protein assembly factor BamB